MPQDLPKPAESPQTPTKKPGKGAVIVPHLPFRESLFFTGLPLGLALSSLQAEFYVSAAILAVVGTVLSITRYKWHIRVPSLRLDDYRSGDFSRFRKIAPFLPLVFIIVAPAIEEALPFSTIQPPTWMLLTAAPSVMAFSFLIHRSYHELKRVGMRRLKAILAKPCDLDSITPERLEAATKHRKLLQQLFRFGAVDGIEISLKDIASSLAAQPEQLEAAIDELSRTELVRVIKIGLQAAIPQWTVSVAPIGVHVLNEARVR